MTDQPGEQTTACPFCAETILAAARKCKHCGEWLDGTKEGHSSAVGVRQPHEPAVPGSTFEGTFRRLCTLLGSTEADLTRVLGTPDQAETNEYGTSFLHFGRYKALFVISDGIAAHVNAPIVDSHGHRLTQPDGFFEIDGLKLGNARDAMTGRLSERLISGGHNPSLEHGPLANGTQYDMSLSFDEDQRWEGLQGSLRIPGRLLIGRPKKMTGWANSIDVYINDEAVGKIANGDFLSFELFEGTYQLSVKGGMMSNSATVSIAGGNETRYEVSFSALGILGGGLKLEAI